MVRIRTHPGEVLREEYLVPLGMSAHRLADALGVPAKYIMLTSKAWARGSGSAATSAA